MSEFIFSLRDVGKVTPRGKILEGIHLSFIYGAKIGVLGLNGSGKSTLLRIIAGEEEYLGEVTHEKISTLDTCHRNRSWIRLRLSVKTSSWVWRRRNFSPISTPSICALAKS